MPGIGTRTEGKRGALYVLLVGEAEDHRSEVKAALAALGDPALEITETVPGGGGTNGGPPPDVTMVLFNGGNEEASLNFLQAQAETSRARLQQAKANFQAAYQRRKAEIEQQRKEFETILQ